jgi:hypothetical protein
VKNKSWGRVSMLFFEHVIGPFLQRELGLLIALLVAWLLGPSSPQAQ